MRIRIVYNSSLKNVCLINTQTEKEISYNSTHYLGKYSPSSGNKVNLFNLEKLVYDIYRNYSNDNIIVTSYSSENVRNIIKNAVLDLKDDRIKFDENNSRLIFNESNIVYSDLVDFYENLNSSFKNLLSNDESKRAELIKDALSELYNLRIDLNEADVVICVAGAYSTGKSTFINSLFGKKLLPRSMNRETAKLCKIKKGQNLKITFTLDNASVVEIFDFEKDTYKIKGDTNHPIISFIMDKINIAQCLIKTKEDYVYYILLSINEFYNTKNYKDAIIGPIDLIVPYDILGNLSYIVYDTPGAGTSCKRDEIELRKIINSPLKPITIFLNTWNTIQDMSVSNLLHAIKTNGNLDNVMYVINQVDVVNNDQLSTLNTKIELLGENNFDSLEEGEIIDMRDSHLFFVSSYGALIGESLLANIDPQSVVDGDYNAVINQINSLNGQYYKLLSIYGSQSSRTSRMISSCEEELEKSKSFDNFNINMGKTLSVNSGMFALKQSLEKLAKDNVLTIKIENLYYEYRKIIDMLADHFNQMISRLQLSVEQKQKDAQILENKLIKQLDDIGIGMGNYVKESITNEYLAAKTDFEKMYDKDTKILAVVDKVKVTKELKRKIKKPANSLKDVYLKLLFNYSHFEKFVKYNIFTLTSKKVKEKTDKNIQLIEEMIEQLDQDYWTIRKQELRKYVKKLLTSIKSSIDLMIDLSAETKKAIQIIPNREPEDNFNLPEFDFEQFRDKKMKSREVKKELKEWLQEALEFRRTIYEREFANAANKILKEICESLKTNMKDISDDLAKQLAAGIDLNKEINEIMNKINEVTILSNKLEEIVGNNIF